MKYAGLWLICLVLIFGNALLWSGLFSKETPTTNTATETSEKVEEETSQNDAPAVSSQPTVFVPILMYHYIRDYSNQEDQLGIQLSVSISTFRRQLTELKNAGYQAITLNDFAAKNFSGKVVVITFDDGYEDHYTDALPVLKELDMVASFFIVRNFIGKAGYLSKSQIDEMRREGMEIGGHSLSHRNLATASYEAAVKDISTSLLGTDNVFCYPSGKYTQETLNIVNWLGVKASVTTNYGIATDKSNLQELPRLRIKEATKLLDRIAEETAIAKSEKTTSQRTAD